MVELITESVPIRTLSEKVASPFVAIVKCGSVSKRAELAITKASEALLSHPIDQS